MIPTFPELRADELLYSGIARCNGPLRFDTVDVREHFYRESARPSAVVDLPGPLKQVSAVLPRPDLLTGETLLLRHTTYPYYAPFVSTDRRTEARRALLHAGPRGVHKLLGAYCPGVIGPDALQFCHECANEEVARHGEPAAWLRAHQLPGVWVCPTHRTPLHESTLARPSGSSSRNHFHALTAGVRAKGRARRIPVEHRPLLEAIAEGTARLLEHAFEPPPDLRARYEAILVGLGWHDSQRRACARSADYHGRRLLPERLLAELGCAFGRTELTWLSRTVWGLGGHPLRHLLLLAFLRLPVSALLGPESELAATLSTGMRAPREDRCLFPTCPRFAGRRTPRDAASRHRWYVCRECETTWRRCADGWQLVRPGASWETLLRARLDAPGVTRASLAEDLGVAEPIMLANAQRLGLAAGRLRPPYAPYRHVRPRSNTVRPDLAADKEWLLLVRRTHPEWCRSEIRASAPGRYNRLWRRARAFAEQHLPAPLDVAHSHRIAWPEEDQRWAAQVEGAVRRILARPGAPALLTAKAIAFELGSYDRVYRHLHRLSATRTAIEHAMTRENGAAYWRRRLAWAVEMYVAQGRVPCRSTLAECVGRRPADELASVVDIDAARDSIRRRLMYIPMASPGE